MDEPQTGAIRMMAFGVLEHQVNPADAYNRGGKLDFERLAADEKRSLDTEVMIVNEFTALGWKLAHTKFGRNKDQFILLGAMGGSKAMPVRPKIAEGSLQDVCRAAVDWLDNGPQDGAPQHTPDTFMKGKIW